MMSAQTERRWWNGARNRERNHARFLIREKIVLACSGMNNEDGENNDSKSKHLNSMDKLKCQDEEEIESCFRAVSLKSACTFSLKKIASNYALLSQPLPAKYMSTYKIKTLCTSRYGIEFAEAALEYSNNLISEITLIEYASMLGEFGTVSSFLSGGINPCNLGHLHDHLVVTGDNGGNNDDGKKYIHAVETLVMKKLVADFVPRSLAVYIIRRIFCMKMWSLVHAEDRDGDYEDSLKCPLCSMASTKNQPLFTFDSSCKHAVCEACMWESIVRKLEDRYEGDVVRCPICDESVTCHDAERTSSTTANEDEYIDCLPSERAALSKTKLQGLPKTSEELRALPKRRKANKAIHSTWNAALLPIIGSSQDVRSDKFYRYVTHGAIHHCRACLRAGVDVNMTNEYNQTPLYISCWRNHLKIVSLLLEWGADPEIDANGEMTTFNVAKENGCDDIVDVLEGYRRKNQISHQQQLTIRGKIQAITANPNKIVTPCLQTLIPREANHIGAGSYTIDNAVPENILQFLESLFSSLPVAPLTEAANKKKKVERGISCSMRHYFCDSEQYLCKTLSLIIESVINIHHANRHITVNGQRPVQVTMFQQMRFLNYLTPGSALSPHIDLVKVDPFSGNGRRSTHTFIMYISDCELGGETALLQELSPDGPFAKHEVLALTTPVRGRMLIFPHACPHEGKEVVSVPKVLLRGELHIE